MMRKWLITASTVRNDRSALFLYNDDALRIGRAGLAAFLRGEPNTLGVRVRPTPQTRWTDDDFATASAKIEEDLSAAAAWLEAFPTNPFRRVIIPTQGLGIEALRHAPRLFADLYFRIVDMERAFGVEQLHTNLLFETTHDGLAIPIQRALLPIPLSATPDTAA